MRPEKGSTDERVREKVAVKSQKYFHGQRTIGNKPKHNQYFRALFIVLFNNNN